MSKEDCVSRALAVTDETLREVFPSDYFKRCMYAAFGLGSLLGDAGIRATVVGGDFLCAVVSQDGRQMNLQGFGTTGVGEPSHFWVEAQGLLLDLGTTYLPYESSFAAAQLPAVRWPLSSALPDFLRYRECRRYLVDAEVLDSVVRERRNAFVSSCRHMNAAIERAPKLKTWQLRDMASLQYAAERGDRWAQAVVKFLQRSLKAEFPSK